MLLLLRYPQEMVGAEEYNIPEGAPSSYRISDKEIQMAQELIESMSDEWKPGDYRDDYRDRLRKVIEKRLKSKGVVTPPEDDEGEPVENASTNVVDFMALLQKSLASNKRTPARKVATKKAAKRAPKKKAAAKPAGPAKKKPAKTAKKGAARKTG
jgi:DNA end-binding protein Ku